MRIFLLLALVAVAWGVPHHRRIFASLLPWEEWEENLGITGPGTQISGPQRVCDGDFDPFSSRFTQVCCEGYTGRVEDGCPIPVCDRPCQNGGTCAAPNVCVCPKAYSGDTCSILKPGYQWSEWVNLDRRNITGDFEPLYGIREVLEVCKNSVPEDIECQTAGGIDHTVIGQALTCDRRLGLKCRNDEQPNDLTCLDYQIRILCPVKDKATTGKPAKTCVHKTLEYNPGEVVKDGDCSACKCEINGHWECYMDTDYCDTTHSTTPAPLFPWLPSGVLPGQCVVGETIFNPGDTTTLDCKMCTCDMTSGWICVDINDPTCVAPPNDDYCRIDDHFIFFHGQTAKKDCNACICKNSEWDCTQTICPDKSNRNDYFFQCVNPETNDRHNDGDIVVRDCNVCVCTQSKWDCTLDQCVEGTSYDSFANLAAKKVCTTPTGLPFPHGTTISQDCNACKCFDGKWQCTRRFCSPELYPNSTCVDEVTASLVKSGQTIRRGCNVCLCNGGNLTCTSKPCETNNGICFDEQRRFATTSTSFDRQYRPVCNNDGTFSPIQCNPLHGVCFCVSPLGHVVPGTTVRQDTGTPNCSPYTGDTVNPLHFTMPSTETDTFPCIETTRDTDTRLTGYNTPKCLDNGYFAPLQCDPHTGVCYCVTMEGTTIPGTVLHVSQGRPNCDMTRDDIPVSTTTELKTPCRQEKETAERLKLPFVPQCDQNGQYEPMQTNSHLNIYFCVDVNGVVIEQTISKSSFINCNQYINYVLPEVKPYTTKVDTENRPHILQTYPIKDAIHKTPRCKLQRLISQFVSSVYRPSCLEDGRFMPEQCPSNTYTCFCVDVTGAMIPETVRRVGYQGLDCNTYSSVLDVVTPANTSTIRIHPEVSLIHSGWEAMLRVSGDTQPVVGPQYTRITKPTVLKTNVTTCQRQQQIATMVPGVFSPSCHHNGSFNNLQHQPLSRQVFCVDKNGVKIEGTEMHVEGQPLPDCTLYWNTTVNVTKVSKHWSRTPQDTMATKPIPLDSLFPAGLHHHPNCTRQQEIMSRLEGGVVPTCEPNGTYTPLQCNATTGVCYCMLPYGDVLPDTVLPMAKGTPHCWHLRNVSLQQSTTNVPDVCRLPVVQGPCRARFIRWAFSKLLNKCHMFVYGGCRGNDNQFQTKEDCENTCGYLSAPPVDPRPVTCERKVARFNRMSFAQRLSMKRPMCTPDGNYKPRQCHLRRTDEGMIEDVCECVHRMTGEVQACEEEERMNPNEHLVAVVTPTPTPEIDGCLSDGVMYHKGDHFFKECNKCTCLGKNQRPTCTSKPCIPNCYDQGIVKQRTVRGCDECTCIGRRWSCTAMPNCVPNQQPTPAPETVTTTQCVRDDGRVMVVGSFYYKECNKCICMPDGTIPCGTNNCIPRHCYHRGKAYHNNDRVMMDCNECTCFGSQWQCQDNVCDPFISTRVRLEGCEYKGQVYTKGDTFHERCNECQCRGNNVTSCSRERCNPTSCYRDGVEIRNTETRTLDCESCTCYNGLMDCVEETECLDVMVEVNLDPTIKCHFEGKTYTNGEPFMNRCKHCRCSDTGEVECEDKACSPNLCYDVEGVPFRSRHVLLTDVHQCTCFRGGEWVCVDRPQDAGVPTALECPSSRPAIFCETHPCDGKVCPNHPEAQCVPDYCGKCLPAFFDEYGNRVQC